MNLASKWGNLTMPATIDPATIATIEDRTVMALARIADCADPDAEDSPGARVLTYVRDRVAECLRDHPDGTAEHWEDTRYEIADGAPSVYTAKAWLEFVDLAAWQEDPTEIGREQVGDLTAAARVCLYMIADRLAEALYREARPEDEDEDEDELL